ncbi:MAG TPA: hypothetical protein VLA58_06035 [Chitinophagaceae bacterium]|nr:hypothetical protein [Chitinophagaceae bacterium]
MERAEVLMLKLQEQFRKKESPAQMLLTLQLLQQELMQMSAPVANGQRDRSKVSVVLPFPKKQVPEEQPSIQEEKILQVLQIDEDEVARELELMKQAADMKNESSMNVRPAFNDQYDPLEEVPTLASHIPASDNFMAKALQEVPTIPEPTPVPEPEPAPLPFSPYLPQSPGPAPAPKLNRPKIEFEDVSPVDLVSPKDLNDKLKEQTRELAQKLQDVPIKDLRKAIGINDRYLYINELFNGDEAMFERSVKTLNHFSILPEAEFWMQRELRIKLGWKEDNLLVQQFVQLVRRRFA